MKERILESKSSVLYIFRNKETGEYVDENYDPTENIYEAIGYADKEKAIKEIDNFDEPGNWYIVTKVINMTVIGEPIEVTTLI